MAENGQQAEKIVPSCCTVKKKSKKSMKIQKAKNKKMWGSLASEYGYHWIWSSSPYASRLTA